MYSAARNCAERRVDGAEEAIFSFEKNIENEASPFRLHPFAGLLTLALQLHLHAFRLAGSG
jgi:hypothetical protein